MPKKERESDDSKKSSASLTGGHEFIPLDGVQISAPRLHGEITVLSGGGGRGHFDLIGEHLPGGDPNLEFAVGLNECQVARTIILKVKAPDLVRSVRAESPPPFARIRTTAQRGHGSIIRVVHEFGHATWHLPLNTPAPGGSSPTFFAGTWDYDIPHVDSPGGDVQPGPFANIGRKVITELIFPYAAEMAGDWAVKELARILQNNRPLGLKRINLETPRPPFADFPPPPEVAKPPRVLLLIHGTASSISGCFDALLNNADFKRWSKRYGHILGFEHDSLTLSPEENAQLLHERVEDLVAGHYPVDAITHSRGGLVARWTNELSTGGADPIPINVFDRLLMFASPNSGTPIAENLVGFVNLLQNTVRMVPDFALKQFLATILAIVKCAAHGVKELPGIAAQAPASRSLTALNSPPDGGTTQYSIAAADFRPDGYLTRLMTAAACYPLFRGEENDLVVPVRSVAGCVPGQRLTHQWNYAGTKIWHCTFFNDPETLRYIDRTLS